MSNTTPLLTPDGDHKITVLKHMEEYYLKKGYLQLKKNFINKKFNFKFFRKLKILIKLIISSDLIFHDPIKRDIVIYDCVTINYIKKILPNDDYKVISTRIKKIKEIYISKKIFLFIISNFFKRSLKQNYLASLIKIISPKIVITHIDNSSDFYITAKIFGNKIKFIAIQNANRGDTVYAPIEKNKKIFIPEFLCFGGFDKELYINKKCNIGKFEIVGSLRSSLSNEYVKSKRINIDYDKYDICLISECHPIVSGGDYDHITNFAEAVGKIADYTYSLCKKKNLSLIFSGNPGDDPEMEFNFYKHYLKNRDFKIFQTRDKFATYQNIMQSKLIIGHISTVLREAFSFEKKVLSCNFTEHPDIIFPSNGICVLKNVTYNLFEERVLQILSISKQEYFNRLSKQKDFIMKPTIDTANIIRRKLKRLLTTDK